MICKQVIVTDCFKSSDLNAKFLVSVARIFTLHLLIKCCALALGRNRQLPYSVSDR